jgi:hypothetical protein
MAKKIVITDNKGEVIETTVSDDATARAYEDLVLVPGGHINKVVVTDADAD